MLSVWCCTNCQNKTDYPLKMGSAKHSNFKNCDCIKRSQMHSIAPKLNAFIVAELMVDNTKDTLLRWDATKDWLTPTSKEWS